MICLECGGEFEGRADARFCSGACRARYHRKAESQIDVVVRPEPAAVNAPSPASPPEALEDYLQRELAVTRRLIEDGSLRDHDGGRLQRSETYLRWRYEEFAHGRVASL